MTQRAAAEHSADRRAVEGAFDLTSDERRAWGEDGFFFRCQVFSADEVAELGDAAERVVEQTQRSLDHGRDRYAIDGNQYVETPTASGQSTVQLEHRTGSTTIRVIEPFHHIDPVFEALVDDARIVAPVRGLVGAERVAIFTDKLNLKRPREGSGFSWHQDSPYWAHFCDQPGQLDQLPNVMVALDDAQERNGCFRVIRGSHRGGLLPGCEGQGVLGPLFTRPDAFDLREQVLAEVPAGSLVFFSPHTVHGSEPNRSEAARRALVLTYQPAGRRMFKVDRVRDAGSPTPLSEA